MSNGEIYRIPLKPELDIILDVEPGFGVFNDSNVKISYKIVGGGDATIVRCISPNVNNFIYPYIKPVDSRSGFLFIQTKWDSRDENVSYGDYFDGMTGADLI